MARKFRPAHVPINMTLILQIGLMLGAHFRYADNGQNELQLLLLHPDFEFQIVKPCHVQNFS